MKEITDQREVGQSERSICSDQLGSRQSESQFQRPPDSGKDPKN